MNLNIKFIGKVGGIDPGLSITPRFFIRQIYKLQLKYMKIIQWFGRSGFHHIGAIHELPLYGESFIPISR